MNCPYCHNETEDTAAFCTKCGKRIPRCPTCGEVITARIRFCTKDGTPIPEELTRDLPGLDDTVVVPPVTPTETWEEPPTQNWTDPEEIYQQPPTEEEPPKKSGGTVIAVILAVIVVAVIAVVVLLWTKGMLGQSDRETDEENQTSIVEEESEAQDDEDEEQTEDVAEETGDESDTESEDEGDTEEKASEDETADEAEETQQIDVSLTTDELTVYEGMTYQIIGDNADQVSWTYSVAGVVEVDSSGQLTAKAAGTTVATATGPNGETDSVEVTVLALETDDQETEETENDDDTGVTATSDDYVLPNSSSEYLSESDLYGLTEWECRVARNEIYARHGAIFTSPELQEYFESKSWYQGTIESAAFDNSVFNEYELANVYLIKAYEEKMNYNQIN